MKNPILLSLAAFLVTTSSYGQIVVESNNSDEVTKDYVVSVGAGGALSFTDSAQNNGGDTSVAAGFEGNSFSWSINGSFEWSATDAQTNLSNNTFDAYISGLVSSWQTNAATFGLEIDPAANGPGVNSGTAIEGTGDTNPNRLNLLGEALIYEFANSGFTAGQLLLESVGFINNTAPDRMDLIFYDASEESASIAIYNVGVNTTNGTIGAELDTGDLLIIATGADNTDAYRAGSLTFTVVPEPSSFGLFASMFGVTLIGLRRRRS